MDRPEIDLIDVGATVLANEGDVLVDGNEEIEREIVVLAERDEEVDRARAEGSRLETAAEGGKRSITGRDLTRQGDVESLMRKDNGKKKEFLMAEVGWFILGIRL